MNYLTRSPRTVSRKNVSRFTSKSWRILSMLHNSLGFSSHHPTRTQLLLLERVYHNLLLINHSHSIKNHHNISYPTMASKGSISHLDIKVYKCLKYLINLCWNSYYFLNSA